MHAVCVRQRKEVGDAFLYFDEDLLFHIDSIAIE